MLWQSIVVLVTDLTVSLLKQDVSVKQHRGATSVASGLVDTALRQDFEAPMEIEGKFQLD